MSQYQLSGYLSALDMRPFRTLLVEGPTDLQIVSRLLNSLIEKGEVAADSVVIDTADLIDRQGHFMGVREFVEFVHASSTASEEQFFVLVDREFRGFLLGPPPIDMIATHHMPAANCMWTRGHSIENYMFTSECIIDYLRHHYPESVPVTAYGEIHRQVRNAVAWCAALSLALCEEQQIKRAEGLCQVEHWIVAEARFDAAAFAVALAKRCPSTFDHEGFRVRIQEWHTEIQQVPAELSRWIAHGHLSYSVLWAAVARTLSSLGVAPKVVEQIAKGMNDNKLRAAASWWQSQVTPESPEYPHPLIEWLKKPIVS